MEFVLDVVPIGIMFTGTVEHIVRIMLLLLLLLTAVIVMVVVWFVLLR